MSKCCKKHHILITCDGTDGNTKKEPMISGVKNTVDNLIKVFEKRGHKITQIHPYMKIDGKRAFRTRPFPMYKSFEFVTNPVTKVTKILGEGKPDVIFNSTNEGPLGIATLLACKFLALSTENKTVPYTASYHTNLDQYFTRYIETLTNGVVTPTPHLIHPIIQLTYVNAYKVMVPTKNIAEKLSSLGLKNTVVWPRGVDSFLFRPPQKNEANPYEKYPWYKKDPKPILLYFGRVALEKNIEDFLALDLPQYYKVVIGDGPHLANLKKEFSQNKSTYFLGAMFGKQLAKHVRFATLLVFPSKTDTFGNVLTEAGASGVPAVAYNVTGPKNVIIPQKTGVLVEPKSSLARGVSKALEIDRETCAKLTVEKYSWDKATDALLKNLKPIQWK